LPTLINAGDGRIVIIGGAEWAGYLETIAAGGKVSPIKKVAAAA
jgi:hypothetical protein